MSGRAQVPSARGPAPSGEHTNGRLLTAEDLAARWQVPKSHVYRLTRTGAVPAVKLGRYYRYEARAIERFEAAGGVAADG